MSKTFKLKYVYHAKFNDMRNLILEAKEDIEKFTKWVLDGSFVNDSNRDEVNRLVQFFLDVRKNIKSPYNDFYWWIKNSNQTKFINYIQDLEIETQNKKNTKKAEKDGARLVYSDNDWKVYEITTYEASAKYGKGTKWCISGSKRWANGEEGAGYFDQYYSQDGVRFYFFINKNTKYALAVYPDNSCEIFNAEDVGIPYIPNAPVIDEIKADYKNESEDNILINAIMNKKIDSKILKQIIQETFTDNTGYECEIYSRDELNDLLTAVDNMIPDGYLEYEACANGDITPEEYTRLTGEEFDEDSMWDGDFPAFSGYELACIKGNTKEEKLDSLKYTLENEAEYIILEEDNDGWLIIPIKDYTELFMWANNRCGISDWSDGELDDFFINSFNLEHVHPGRLYVFPVMLANRLIWNIKEGNISSSVLNGLGLSKDYLSKFNKNYDENLNESEKVSEDVYFHGSVEEIDGYLNRPINWITKDYDYAKTFALGNGYVYKCSATLGNLLDVGKTDARVFDMIPSTPLKFSREFTAIIRRLNISEDAIRKVIDNVADEYSVNPYRLAIRPVVRSMAFKRILEGLGYNGIKAIEYDSINDKNVETFGLFDNVKVLGKVEESLKEYLDDLGTYSGTNIYVTDSAYQLKNLLLKGDKPYRIYQWKGAYYFCSALGDMTHNGMMQYLFDKGYADGDGFDEWGVTNYMVFIPKNFDTNKLVYDTSLGSDEYYYCRVYAFGVMFVRDYSTYSNSLFSALGTPEREVFLNEEDGLIEIEKDGKHYEVDWNNLRNIDDALTMKLGESLDEEKAITWGDLDYAKKTDTRKMMGGRGTGHFGTGFYFVGKDGPYGLDKDNNIKSYDYEPSRPIYEIELDNYNLYKPTDNDSAYRLHDTLKLINGGYEPSLDKWLNLNLDEEELDDELYNLGWTLVDEDFDDDIDLDFDDDDLLDTDEESKDYEDAVKEQDKSLDNYRKLVKEFIAKYELEDYVWKDIDTLKTGEIERHVIEAIHEKFRSLDLLEYALDTLSEMFNVSKENLLDIIHKAYESNSEDSISTLVMKGLGYEGVDVTHLNHDAQGLSGLDNFGYGTVVYDLKPGTFKRIKEPRKGGSIHAKAGESLKEDADMNAIEFAEKNIGTSDRPIDGPSYIMPSGRFLTIWKSNIPVSKYSASGSATHRDVQQYLYDNGYAKEDFWQVEDPDLEKLGCIRVNSGFEEYIWLPDNNPNNAQWNSLLMWLDWYFRFHHKLMVGFKHYAPKTYYDNDYTTDEILKKCKEAYGRGYLTEKIVKLNNGKYQVQSEKGRNLGTYNTKKEAEDRLKDVEMFKHMNEEVEIKGDEFSFTLEDICKKYPDLVSNSYESCGPAFIMPDGKYLLSGKRFDMHGDLAFQCLMDIEGLSEQEIENEFDTSNLTNFFTRFFKLVRVNDGSKADIEDRAYFVIPYNSITSGQMNALQDFVDYILKNKYSKKIYDIQAFVGTHYAHQKWDLQFNNPTSDEIMSDVRFAMTRGFFGESLDESKEDYQKKFDERTHAHIDRVNKYAKKIDRSYPNHDSDKFNELFDGYSLMNKKDVSEEEQKMIDDATYKHVINNEHHPEHWCNSADVEGFSRKNPNPHGCLDCSKMSESAMTEMCCDWCAMSEEFNNTPFEWFDKVKDTRWHFNEEQEKFILDTLHKLWDSEDIKEDLFDDEDVEKDDYEDVLKQELDRLNNWLDKYGFEVELISDYKFGNRRAVGMFLNSIQDNASVFPIALNKKYILKYCEEETDNNDDYNYELMYAIRGTLWHEAGHGILNYLEDFYDFEGDEEDWVEDFAEFEESSDLFKMLQDYMKENDN